MAGAFSVIGQAGNAASGTAYTLGVTYQASERPVLVVAFRHASATVTVGDGGTHTYTQIGTYVRAPSDQTITFFNIQGTVTPGSYTVTVTPSVASTMRFVAYLRGTGLDTNAAQDGLGQNQTAAGTGTDAISSTNLTPTSQPNTVLGVTLSRTNTVAITAGTGYTDLSNFSTYDGLNADTSRAEYKNTSSTSAVAATFTHASSDDMITFGAVFGDYLPPPTITVQPADVIASVGATAQFTIGQTGGTSFQWEYNDGTGWANVSGGSGGTTDTYTTPTLVKATHDSWRYRCTVTNAYGSTTSDGFAVLRVATVLGSYSANGIVIGSATAFVGDGAIGAADAAAGGTTINATRQSLAITERASDVNLNFTTAASSQAIALTELAADIDLDKLISAILDSLSLTEQQADVVAGSAISAGTDSISLQEQAQDINLNVNISAALQALTLTEASASTTLGIIIDATSDPITVTANGQTITTDFTLSANFAQKVIASHQAFLIDSDGETAVYGIIKGPLLILIRIIVGPIVER